MQKPFYTGGHEQAQLYQNQAILNQVQQINAGVQQNNQALNNYVTEIEKKIQALEKSKRRSLESVFIAVQTNGTVLLVYAYDSGDTEGKVLATNLIGNWKIYRLKFKKTEQKSEKFAIVFPNTSIYIVGNFKKNSGAGLFDYFVKAGVVFNPLLKDKEIKKALFTTFSPLIENCRNVLEIPELAGWYRQKFIHADNYLFDQRSDFPDLPIFEKHFPIAKKEGSTLKDYLHLMCKIKNCRDRIVLIELPIIGMLTSLFVQSGMMPSFYVNLIFLDDTNRDIFVKFTQIFNRDMTEIVRADANDTELRKELLRYNDEVLILDASRENLSQYQKKKIHNNVKRIKEKILENSISYGIQQPINVALMILNVSAECGKQALNLFIDKNFFRDADEMDEIYQSPEIDGFIHGFIDFVQTHFDEVVGIIEKFKNLEIDKRTRSLEAAFEILTYYSKSVGIDLIQEAQLPKNIDFEVFFDDIFDTEDLLEIFKRIVRKEIGHFTLFEKGKGNSEKKMACFFNTDNLWIHPQILDRILGKNGILPLKLQILSRAKESGALKTDGEGLTRRLQIYGSRSEFYQFSKDFFNEFGMTDIIDLGKEDERIVKG